MSDVQEPLSWGKSTATEAVLEQLVDDRLLPVNINSERPVWIPPWSEETEPSPPDGYIVSLMRLHERRSGIPVGRFMWALCNYYGVELHNFGPNSISQAAVLIALCKGYLGSRRTGIYGSICSAASSTSRTCGASRRGSPAPAI